jgi:predicted aconitase with swiveling domain
MTPLQTLIGCSLVPGCAEAPLLYTSEPLSFWGGYDARSGRVIDRRHRLAGQNGAGHIMAIPATRGSSTTTAVLLEAVRRGTAPVGFLTREPDSFLALAAIVAAELYGRVLPVVALDPLDFDALRTVKRVRIEESGAVIPD